MTPQEVINLDAYPIGDTNSPAFEALCARLRGGLDARQYVVLPDFIRRRGMRRSGKSKAFSIGRTTIVPTAIAIFTANRIRHCPGIIGDPDVNETVYGRRAAGAA